MLIQDVKKLDPYQRLVYWIQEREKIRIVKEKGKPKPWTDDVILQSYRFCNVRRMDDAVSEWLLDNWYKPYFNHSNMVIACVLARHFNKPSTLKAIGFPNFDSKCRGGWDSYIKYALKMIEKFPKGQTTFNAAYIIRASGEYPNKVSMVFNETVQQFVDTKYIPRCQYMEDLVAELMNFRNIGSFMAGQIAADLRWAVKGEFKDKNTWAAMGPGSKRGMNRLHERDLEFPLRQDQFTEELQQLIKAVKRDVPKSIWSRMEAIDHQNVLCETDKLNRVLNGEGRPKQKYPGVAQ